MDSWSTIAASSGWAHTRTAAWARSTWPSTSARTAPSIGKSCASSVVLSTIFLDDVVDANAYVPAVPQLKEAAHRARRIGLGIMGLADLMYHCGIRYGSPEGQEFAAQVMEFVRYHAMPTSVELAAGPRRLPRHRRLHLRPQGPVLGDRPPPWRLTSTTTAAPPSIGSALRQGILQHGIRNAAQTTIAPTGTIATVAGCEGYGCEPVFALAYIRHVNDNGKDLQLTYASPAFEEALQQAGIEPEKREEILEQIMREGTCQNVDALPEEVRNVFVVSADITADEHVRMQAALQAFVDNSSQQDHQLPPRRHRRRRRQRLHAGLGTGLQGHHRLRHRLARQGRPRNARHRREESKPPRPRRRPRTTRRADQLHLARDARSRAPDTCPATPTPSKRRSARPSSPSTKTAAASPSKSSSTPPRPAPTPPPSPRPSAA